MKTNQKTTPTIQKLFVWSALVAWAVSCVQVIVIAAMQYPNNQNLSGLVPWFLFSFGVPLVLVGIVYATKRNRTLNLQNTFEVAIVSVAMLFVSGALMSLLSIAPMPWMYMSENIWLLQLITTGLPLVLSVLLFAYALYRLRRSGQW